MDIHIAYECVCTAQYVCTFIALKYLYILVATQMYQLEYINCYSVSYAAS